MCKSKRATMVDKQKLFTGHYVIKLYIKLQLSHLIIKAPSFEGMWFFSLGTVHLVLYQFSLLFCL